MQQEYSNESFEKAIMEYFEKCIDDTIECYSDSKDKGLIFDAYFKANQPEFDNNINSWYVEWNKPDGNVTLKYRPFFTVSYTVKQFYVDKLKTLNK